MPDLPPTRRGGVRVMFDNRLPADQLDSLAPGDSVLIEVWPRGWRDPEFATALVVRTTATQIVVTRKGSNGGTYEQRFRKRDAQLVGESTGKSELVDPSNPRTIEGVNRARRRSRQSAIDSLAYQWARNRDDLDVLRRLHVAISDHLDAETQS